MSSDERKERIVMMIRSLQKKPLTAGDDVFVTSLLSQFRRKGDLSDKQIEVLQRLYTSKFRVDK